MSALISSGLFNIFITWMYFSTKLCFLQVIFYASEYLTEEMVADLVGFTLSEPDILEKLTGQQRTVLQKFVDKLVSMFGDKNLKASKEYLSNADGDIRAIFKDVAREADSIAEQFKAALDTSQKAEKNTVERDGVVRNSVSLIKGKNQDYGTGVYLDTDIFEGISPRSWGKELSKFVYKNLAGKDTLAYDNNGTPEVIYFAKKEDRVQKNGSKNYRRVLDELAYAKGNVEKLSVVHIDELLKTSEVVSTSEEKSHQWLDANGWEHRLTYVQDIYGRIYEATLNIGKDRDGKKVLYSVSNVKKVDEVPVSSKSNAQRDWTLSANSDNNYTQNNGNVNRYSRDITEAFDNNGKKLTEKQSEYFADSKVRDKNGNLKVMYRGDANEITVFDRKKSKPSNLYGRGFYFTDSKSHAEQYGKATEYYLNIENPLMWNQNKITKKQILDFLKVIENNGEDYDLYNYGQDATAESVLDMVWGKGDLEMLQDINAGAIGDLVAAVELFNEVNGTNYDGLILPSETVTFSSEQAKLTSNLNPTKNPDTRYSKELFPDDRTMSAEEIENDEIEQYIQQIKSSDDLSDADAEFIRQEILQSRKQQREQLLAEIATTNLARWGAELGK